MKMTYVVKHKDLGLLSSFIFDEVKGGYIPIFTKDHENEYIVPYVSGFKNIEIASKLKKLLSFNTGMSEDEFTIVKIDTKNFNKAVSYKEILDNGLASDAGYMIHSVHMISTAIH